MHLLLFPTLLEARAAIELCGFQQTAPSVYSNQLCYLVITGAAPFSAHLTTLQFLQQHQQVVEEVTLLGFAGSCNPAHTIGQLLEVSEVAYQPFLHQSSYCLGTLSPIKLRQTGVKLLTVDVPQYHPIDHFDGIVDMEGYAIAYATKLMSKKLSIQRIVSDHCSTMSSMKIAEQASQLSLELGKFVKQYIMERFAISSAVSAEATTNLPLVTLPLMP